MSSRVDIDILDALRAQIQQQIVDEQWAALSFVTVQASSLGEKRWAAYMHVGSSVKKAYGDTISDAIRALRANIAGGAK